MTTHGNLTVAGRQILTSVLDAALVEMNLAETLEEIVLTGCSAGGTGVYFNVDFVREYVQSQLTGTARTLKMRAFGNAGWFLDTNKVGWNGDGWSKVPGIQRGCDTKLFTWAGLAATLSTSCQASYAPLGEQWKCAMSQYLYPFIESPTLVLQSSYDLNQLVTGGPKCVNAAISGGEPLRPYPNTFSECSATEVEVINRYGDALNASMVIARRGGAVFAPTCTIHCYTGHWTQIKIGGVTMADAIGQFQAARDPRGLVWYDTCRGGNCNPTCPTHPAAE